MPRMNWLCYPEHLRPSDPPTDEEVGTSELTEEEVVFARAHGILRVEEDGCGFVPKQWVEQLRKFRDAMRQPSLLRRIMPPKPVVGIPPYPPINRDEEFNLPKEPTFPEIDHDRLAKKLAPGTLYAYTEPEFMGEVKVDPGQKFELPQKEFCPCGGIILADTEDWTTPICHQCWVKMGSPEQDPGAAAVAALMKTMEGCPECAYEKETGQGAPVPHHCDQMAVDAGYYPKEE